MVKQLFVLLGNLSYYWAVIGTPVGLVLLVVYALSKKSPKPKKLLKLAVLLLLGLPLFILLTFLAYELVGVA